MTITAPPDMIGPVMVDVAGLRLDAAERARLRDRLVGGVILFARNFASRQQLADLCAEIHGVRPERLLIAVDHEGGRVQRFRTDGFTALPAMRALGQAYQVDAQHGMVVATAVGYVLAAELRACGVDFSFTPVLDLDYGVSQVIGDRAFDADPRVVADLARALMLGMARAGMGACGKHFPGHGAVAADSHHAVPRDERPLQVILEADVAPYRWLGDLALPAVMPAHVIYPQVDARPAGFSRRWVTEILRERLQYCGAVFSDDLTMAGAQVAGDMRERALAAFAAGCDMVLVCNHPDLADALLADLRDCALDPQRAARVRALLPKADAPGWVELLADPRYLHARSLRPEKISG